MEFAWSILLFLPCNSFLNLGGHCLHNTIDSGTSVEKLKHRHEYRMNTLVLLNASVLRDLG